MQLGASNWAYIGTISFEESLARLKGLGFGRVDLMARPPFLWPSDLSSSARSSIYKYCEMHDLSVESLNPPANDLNICSPVAEVRDYSISALRDMITLASDIGARMVTIVPGRSAALKPISDALSWSWLQEALDRLLLDAEQAGIQLMLENHFVTPFPSSDNLAAVMKHYNSEFLGIAYDVANGEFYGENHVEAIAKLMPWLKQVHLSDATRHQWAHDPIGKGSINFDVIFSSLERHGFQECAIVEIVTADPDRYFAEAISRLGERGWTL